LALREDSQQGALSNSTVLRARCAACGLAMARLLWVAWYMALIRSTSGQYSRRNSDLQPGIFSIHPQGGPVIGGTQVTVTGKDLNDNTMQCIFGNSDSLAPSQGSLVYTSCKYSTHSPLGLQGHECKCEVPPANKREGVNGGRQTYVQGAYQLQVAMEFYEILPAPMPVFFTYFELTTHVNVTQLVPSAGGKYVSTLVTVHGNGFADYGGVFCSYPGRTWNPDMPPGDPNYHAYRFTARATLVDSTTLLCTLPPQGNNTSPVFLEVCMGGHPDLAQQPAGRGRRDDYCTASLHVFEYVEFDLLNFTIYNLSAITGPVAGGTEVVFDTADASDKPGVLSYGIPTCMFGNELPASGAHPLATLHGGTPKMYTPFENSQPEQQWGPSAVSETVARQRMCAGYNQLSWARACSCRNGPATAICGCGCREMLPPVYEAFATTDISGMDQCSEEITFYTDEMQFMPDGQLNPDFGMRKFKEEILCGPTAGAWHRPVAERRPAYATCVAPPRAAGRVPLEYSPSGDPVAATHSRKRKMHFTYYEAYIDSLVPRGSPTDGGTAITVSGHNLWTFGKKELRVNGTARLHDP